jgi:acetyl esterase/lipase
LISGSRRNPPAWLNPQSDHVVISIDYRLAPETKLPAIIEDVQDAFRWIRKQGPTLLNIDVKKLIVGGGSAGGYLTLMTGFCIKPRPRALISLSGYGGIVGPWYSQPSPYYLEHLPRISKEAALATVGTTCVSEPPAPDERGTFYHYCRQNGIWPREVTGHDPKTEREWFKPYCPVDNVSSKYPPTVLIHGTADTDVPYDESANMDKILTRLKVEHKFITVPGGNHGITNTAPAERARIFQKALEFALAHTTPQIAPKIA